MGVDGLWIVLYSAAVKKLHFNFQFKLQNVQLPCFLHVTLKPGCSLKSPNQNNYIYNDKWQY